MMKAMGNVKANQVWEAKMLPRYKPDPAAPRTNKELFIREKYVNRGFLYVRKERFVNKIAHD